MRNILRISAGICCLILFFWLSAFGPPPGRIFSEIYVSAAPAQGADRYQTLRLNSKLMGREMPYRIILPGAYRQADEKTKYPVVYLLHGLTGHYNNWIDRTKLASDYSLKHNTIIVTPEGDNGWYTDSAAKATDKYESYIIKELIPEIDRQVSHGGHTRPALHRRPVDGRFWRRQIWP